MAAGRDAMKSTRQGSRSSKDTSRNLPRRTKATPGSPPHSSGAKSPAKVVAADEEFATQMEFMKEKEQANRKPWPDPVNELKARHAAIANPESAAKYWDTEDAQEVIPAVTKDNEKYWAANGYKPVKVDAATASPLRSRQSVPEQAIADPPPVAPTPPPTPKPPAQPASPMKHPYYSDGVVAVVPQEATSNNNVTASTATKSVVRGKRLVATPNELNFGTLMEGFRYCTTVQVTNVAVGGCRYRVTVDPEFSSWLSIEAPKVPIAAGMSARIDVEICGLQPVGQIAGRIMVDYEGGSTIVEVLAHTRGASERPVPHPKGIKMIGPVALQYKPGKTVRVSQGVHARTKGAVSMESREYNDGGDSD
jgi:hypothetical protein